MSKRGGPGDGRESGEKEGGEEGSGGGNRTSGLEKRRRPSRGREKVGDRQRNITIIVKMEVTAARWEEIRRKCK